MGREAIDRITDALARFTVAQEANTEELKALRGVVPELKIHRWLLLTLIGALIVRLVLGQ